MCIGLIIYGQPILSLDSLCFLHIKENIHNAPGANEDLIVPHLSGLLYVRVKTQVKNTGLPSQKQEAPQKL